MKWQPSGPYGGISGDYRIAAFTVHEKLQWGLFYGWQVLGFYPSKEEAKKAAEKHAIDSE